MSKTFGGYNKDYAESKWLLTAYTCHLSRRSDLKDTVGAYSADPGVSPDSSMWDQQIFVIRFMARYVLYHLTKKSNQAAGCAAHLVAADDAIIESGGYYQSGVLVPPMREDTTSPAEWNKAAEILNNNNVLPKEIKALVEN